MQRSIGFRYGSGYLGIALITYVTGAWVTYFYAPPEASNLAPLLPPAWAGMAFAIGRIVDAVSDPLVGVWSDRHRSGRGRRIPFLRASSLPLALSFALIWLPPRGTGPAGTFAYLSVVLSAYFLFYTLYVAPYLALLPQLSSNREGRLKLSAWQGGFNVAGIAVGAVVAGTIAGAFGFGVMGVALAALSLVSFAVPAWTVVEPPLAPEAGGVGLWDSIRFTLANRPFRLYVAGQFCFWFALNAILIGAPYMITVVAGGTEADASLALGVAVLSALVAFPALLRATNKYGLRRSLIASMIWFAAVLALSGLVGRPFMPLSPYAQALIVNALAGVPIAGLLVLPNAVMAEITDIDERMTGRRREAIYFGVQGLIVKGSMALSSVLTTQLLQTLGYTAEAPWGILGVGPMAALFVLGGVWIFRRYPEHSPSPAGPPAPGAPTAASRAA